MPSLLLENPWLATTSLAPVDPSDLSRHAVPTEADMARGVRLHLFNKFPPSNHIPEVGTRFYIAPEVLSRKRGSRNHNKVLVYVTFPGHYRGPYTVTWLQHCSEDRLTALELSQSSLLPEGTR